MPYKSDAQRRFFHTDSAKKAGITEDEVKEFDQASKGKKLPEKKMAYGGETNPKHETLSAMQNNPTAGFAKGGEVAPELRDDKFTKDMREGFHNGIQGDWEKIKAAIQSYKPENKSDNGNLKGLQNVANQASGKNMAMGGDVDKDEPGLQDATASDFILPALMGMTSGATEGMGERLADEAGSMFPGDMSSGTNMARLAEIEKMEAMKAPEMEGLAFNKPDVEVFSKGVQKGGSEPVTIWGVRGKPEEVAKLGFGTEPGSIPEDVLKQHGLLPPTSTGFTPQNSPNPYAHGGEVKGYADGGNVPDLSATGGMTVTNPFSAEGLGMLPSPNMMAGIPTAPQPPSVDNAFIHQLNMGTALTPPPPQPEPNPISHSAQILKQTPPTSPDIYAGIGAPDRAALAQQLIAQKTSPGGLIASGAGGLADAITSAFGKQPSNFQQNIRGAQNQAIEQRLGVMDTQRQQVLQDLQAKMAVQKVDPNSAVSQGYRQMYKMVYGKTAPSGLSAAMMDSFAPEITKAFEANTQRAIAGGAQSVEAGKALYGETFGDWIKENLGFTGQEAGEKALERATGTPASASASAWKVIR
jgi:hypothetical protein